MTTTASAPDLAQIWGAELAAARLAPVRYRARSAWFMDHKRGRKYQVIKLTTISGKRVGEFGSIKAITQRGIDLADIDMIG